MESIHWIGWLTETDKCFELLDGRLGSNAYRGFSVVLWQGKQFQVCPHRFIAEASKEVTENLKLEMFLSLLEHFDVIEW